MLSIQFDSPVHGLFVISLTGHSFNTTFTICKSVKCIILIFINIFDVEATLNYNMMILLSKKLSIIMLVNCLNL